MVADAAADDELIAGLDAVESERRLRRAHADAGGGQVEPAALPAAHDLGVPGQDADAGFGAAAGDRMRDAFEYGHFQTLLDEHVEAQVARRGAGDGQIVHGS